MQTTYNATDEKKVIFSPDGSCPIYYIPIAQYKAVGGDIQDEYRQANLKKIYKHLSGIRPESNLNYLIINKNIYIFQETGSVQKDFTIMAFLYQYTITN